MRGLMTVILREMFLLKLIQVVLVHGKKDKKDHIQVLELNAKDLHKGKLLVWLNKSKLQMLGLMTAIPAEMYPLQ